MAADSDPRVLITGAASGIGAAVAALFGREGAKLALLDIDGDGLERVRRQVESDGAEVVLCPADVRSEAEVVGALERAYESFGGLDVGVINAAVQLIGEDGPVHELSLEAWEKTIAVNLTGAFLTAKHTVRVMLRSPAGGSIVFTGSPTALRGRALGFDAYSASKAGLHGLARVMANEYGSQGIRVNVVVPGITDTMLTRPLLEDPEVLQRYISRVPLGRIGTAEEVARVIRFVASPEASFMTGSVVVTDGGALAV